MQIAAKAGRLLRLGWRTVEDVIYPSGIRCILCGEPSRGAALCPACAEALGACRIEAPFCPRCGRQLAPGGACADCAEHEPAARQIRSAYRFDGAVRDLVHQAKYGKLRSAADTLAEAMAPLADASAYDAVTWVTMPRTRLRRRGFDHGRTLAAAVAARLKLPLRKTLLRTDEGWGVTQRGLDRQARDVNLTGKFRAAESAAGQRLLLVDDVLTTGATADACASALLQGGCSCVDVLTAASVWKG